MATSPTLSKLDYFCDNTIRRYMMQLVRAFSGYQYVSFPGNVRTLNVVPCLMNQTDALVAAYITKSSEATAPTVPAISITLSDVEYRRNDVQNPTHVSTAIVKERQEVNGAYTGKQGRIYQVDRLMPRPYAITFDIDVWTSNKDQKLQLMEQMLVLLGGSEVQIQNSENPLDWGSYTSMSLEGITYTSAAGPVGTDGSRIDYFTLKIRIPIWLNPPARVTQARLITQIVNNIVQGEDVESGAPFTQEIVTPGQHAIGVQNNVITLLNSKSGLYDEDGQIFDVAELIKRYGTLRPGVTTVRLSTTKNIEDTESDIVGTINYTEPLNQFVFTPDPSTLPADTMPSITGVVNPRQMFPGNGLPNATIGQRYIFIHSITGPNIGWGTLNAQGNDIVSFDGSNWVVVYRPVTGEGLVNDRVTNQSTGRQLSWTVKGWEFTYDGVYEPGYWRLFI